MVIYAVTIVVSALALLALLFFFEQRTKQIESVRFFQRPAEVL